MKKGFTEQKIFEITSAVFRVSAIVMNQHIKNGLEFAAIEAFQNPSESLEKLARIVQLAESSGEISPINAAVLQREIGNLRVLIKTTSNKNEVEIESIFSRPPTVVPKERMAISPVNSPETEKRLKSSNGDDISGQSNEGAEIRQKRLHNKIRQYGNTAMKDLIAEFPDVSERTIRYDLQKLCDQGLIRRIGSGGPGVYYQIIQISQLA